MIRARSRAVVIFAVLSWSSSSEMLKFDFFIQQTADVLSPIDNRYDSGGGVVVKYIDPYEKYECDEL